MTVDMLAATFFWSEGTLLGSREAHSDEAEPADLSPDHQDAADVAARAEGFWSAMVRSVWRPSDAAALP